MMELLKEKDQYAPAFVSPHKTAKMIDSRYDITQEEQADIIRKFFPDGTDGPLKRFPSKEKQRLAVLREIANRLETEKVYDERNLNQILQEMYDDYATIRRYLIEYGFIDRHPDGSEYWLKK
jgi:hypothetical protein